MYLLRMKLDAFVSLGPHHYKMDTKDGAPDRHTTGFVRRATVGLGLLGSARLRRWVLTHGISAYGLEGSSEAFGIHRRSGLSRLSASLVGVCARDFPALLTANCYFVTTPSAAPPH